MEALTEREILEWNWPQILVETLKNQSGLILLSGDRHSKLNDVHSLVAADKSVQTIEKFDPKVKIFADVIIYRGVVDSETISNLLELAEQGRLVVTIMMAPSTLSSLRKVLCYLQGRHLLWRFVDQLQLVMSQMQVHGTKGEDLYVHELMLASPDVKKWLLSENLESLEQSLQETQDKKGIVSFNQAFLQLLIRRRIDIKTAFSKTRDPEHLDMLLKRMGV